MCIELLNKVAKPGNNAEFLRVSQGPKPDQISAILGVVFFGHKAKIIPIDAINNLKPKSPGGYPLLDIRAGFGLR